MDATPCSVADEGLYAWMEGSPSAVGVLAFLNDEATTLSILDYTVGLDIRAAENLIHHRDGADQLFGTADDNLFECIAEVDEVWWVGPSTLETLIAYVDGDGWIPVGDDLLGVYDNVPFTVNEADDTIAWTNEVSVEFLDDDLDLDRRAVDSIVEARPLESVLQLSELYYVGESALIKLKTSATKY
ncbi:MAG: hypothetical protein JRJ84_23480 [Deltaproteobacteria bacterium]|nr:hypothetical protein [Deltaproteobacteria bacterium]